MASRKRIIHGREYVYAEHSFRLPSGKIKKLSTLLKDSSPKEYFLRREIEANAEEAAGRYPQDSVFDAHAIGKLEGIRVKYKRVLRGLTELQRKDMLDRFTANFTYESNALEGNSLTLKDVALVLQEGMLPKGKELREVYETRNTREVNGLLFQRKLKITLAHIRKIHAMLMRDTGVNYGFKRVPNFILGKNIETTPPEKVEAELQKLLDWYHSSRDHPLRLAARFHGRFERIHPFEDGNGRVGRVLINAILLQHKFPPLIIRKTMRLAYLASLEAFDRGHEARLERFLIEKEEDTFERFFEVYVRYV